MTPTLDLRGAKILVTGGTGFIGSHLRLRLSSLGCLVSFTGRSQQNIPGYFDLDLSELSTLKHILSQEKPDIVFHLAASTSRELSLSMLAPMLQENALSIAALCEALQPNAKLIAVGSAEEYGSAPSPWAEDSREQPTSPYGLSKLFATNLARLASSSFGLHAVSLRPSIVYGPGQRPNMFIPSLIATLQRGDAFAMTQGEQQRDFIFVDDVVDALLAALHPMAAGQVFNISTGAPTQIVTLAQLILKLINKGSLQIGALPYRANEVMQQQMNPQRAKLLLGWQAKTSLEDGLRQTLARLCRASPTV